MKMERVEDRRSAISSNVEIDNSMRRSQIGKRSKKKKNIYSLFHVKKKCSFATLYRTLVYHGPVYSRDEESCGKRDVVKHPNHLEDQRHLLRVWQQEPRDMLGVM